MTSRRNAVNQAQTDGPNAVKRRRVPADAPARAGGRPECVNLSGEWRILGVAPQCSNPDRLRRPDPRRRDWLPCAVPGDVNAALVELGRMPDPRFGANGRRCGWVIGRDWWFRRVFDLDRRPGSAALLFSEVYGPADLWLNGRCLGAMRNAFREFRFDVSALLKPRGNELLLRFRSIERLIGRPADPCFGWEDAKRGTLRMPNYTFGWDWALPLPPIGLGAPVTLEMDRSRRLLDVSARTFTSGRVDFSFEVTPEARDAGYRLEVEVRGHGARVKRAIERGLEGGESAGDGSWRTPPPTGPAHRSWLSLNIPRPKLWWPRGHGAQPLYDYSVSLIVAGKLADRRAGRLGLREVRLIERPFRPRSGHGMTMALEVNGVEIFCKGANWVPLELWPGAAKAKDYDFYLRKCSEANFNMLRVWGGGLYERDRFYDRCDELGLMVWQDFMFASQGYPLPALRDEILAEARSQLRRLRNHPAVVLWCGCNEDVHSWSFHSEIDPRPEQAVIVGKGQWRFDRTRQDPELYALLRGLTAQWGLGAPFVQSSPASREDAGNAPHSGNSHISCWKHALFNTDGRPERFRGHFEQVCSFNSEFCIQGPCSVAAFRKFMPPESLWPPNGDWLYHIQRGHRRLPHHEQTLRIAGALFGEVRSLQDYVKHGQAAHAEMMRAEFESARRDRPDNGGAMVWQFNDCWPTSNWSIIDYYRRPKPAYYAARRACAPLLPILFERGGRIEFFFANDSRNEIDVELTYGREDLSGRRLWTRRLARRVAANCTERFDSLARDGRDAPGEYLFIDARADGRPLDRVTYFPALWKDLPWPDPHLSATVAARSRAGGLHRLTLRLRAEAYARFCHLRPRRSDPRVDFSDNYFDLCADGERSVEITSPARLSLDDLLVGHWLTEWE
jgi:beta-mannosidase